MMDNSITYTNCEGESVEMRIDGKWHYGDTDLHDYEWAYDSVSDRVAGFRREPRDYRLHVMLRGAGTEERNRALDVFESDVAALEPGTLRVGGSELRCWVIASSKDKWWYDEGSMDMDITVHADDPSWTREASFSFAKLADVQQTGGYDYPHDYPHDYRTDDRSESIANPFGAPSACRITVYGPAVNPYVIIGDNRYQVDIGLGAGDLLVVDGRTRTITFRSNTGQEMSAFSSGVRDEGARIFGKVPAGTSIVRWSGSFGFDVDLIEERSEPWWG